MFLRRQFSKVLRPFTARHQEDLAEEIAVHLEIEKQENMQNGMSEEEARYAALRKFGNVSAVKEESRREWNWDWADRCVQDLRYASVSLRRNPLFAFSAMMILALGLTAVTTVFSIVDAVLLRPSSFAEPDSITTVQQWRDDQGWSAIPPSVYAQLRDRHDLFQRVVAQRRATYTITNVPVPDQLFGGAVTGNLFSILPVKPLFGRMLQPSDDSPSSPPVMLLGYRGWQHLFAGDPNVLGRAAEVDGRATTIVGVMPESFIMPGRPAELWLPLGLTAADLSERNGQWVETLGQLKPGVFLRSASAALDLLAAAWNRQGDTNSGKLRLRVVRWRPDDHPTRNTILWVTFGTVLGLLAIGCTNVSSLFLARGISRRRDYAIRIATGASNGRLIRQCLLEALLLSFLGLAISLIFSASLIHFLRESINGAALGISDVAHASIDPRLVVFSFVISLLAALASAGLPAWVTASLDLSEGLREGGTQAATGKRVRKLMESLTGIQTAICVLLLIVSGLLVSSLVRLTNDDHGIRADHVLTMRLPSGPWFRGMRTADEKLKQTRRYLNLLDRVQSVDGVVSAALSSSLPLSNVSVTTRIRTPSEASRADNPLVLVRTKAVTGGYFQVMGIPLVAGRLFRPTDGPTQPKVAIINQAFADRFFRGSNPVGRFVQDENGSDSAEVVGVIRNTAQLDLDKPAEPEMFISFNQTLLTPFLTGLVVRTSLPPESVAPVLRATIAQEDPQQPVVKVRTLRSLISDNIALSRSSAWTLSVFAAIALALSSAGIYGVVSFATLARQRDFGIRLCLGATRAGIFKSATLRALIPVFIGVLAGLGAALGLARTVSAV
ncbi:MAG: ADOP family duplicated permease, partial [Bryobacteraceae bacterium]